MLQIHFINSKLLNFLSVLIFTLILIVSDLGHTQSGDGGGSGSNLLSSTLNKNEKLVVSPLGALIMNGKRQTIAQQTQEFLEHHPEAFQSCGDNSEVKILALPDHWNNSFDLMYEQPSMVPLFGKSTILPLSQQSLCEDEELRDVYSSFC